MSNLLDNDERIINSKEKSLWLNLKSAWEYKDLIFLFVKRNFILYYKQTLLGPLWYVIVPILSTIMYMFVFGSVAKIGTDGIPQPLFYFSGLALWGFFSEITQQTSAIFNNNKGIFSKIYFPRLTVPVSIIFTVGIKLIIQLFCFFIVYVVFVINGYCKLCGFEILILPLLFLWLASFASGLGLIICSITAKYKDLLLVISLIINLFMYATPVVYPFSQVPKKIHMLFYMNPLTVPFELFRRLLFKVGEINILGAVYSLFVTLLVLLLGLICFTKNEREFLDYI